MGKTTDSYRITTSNDISGYMHVSGNADHKTNFILVHGIGVSSRYFMPLARELAAYGRVYAIDLPGFGKTKRPMTPLSISDYATFLHECIVQKNIKSPILVGHSMGSQIVIEYVARYHEDVSRLVLIGPVVNPAEKRALKQMVRLAQDGLHEPFRVNLMMVEDYLRCGPRWYFNVLPEMMNYPMEKRLEAVSSKTLVVRGAHDVISSRTWTRKVVDSMQDAELLELPDSGHVAMYVQAKVLAEKCKTYFINTNND